MKLNFAMNVRWHRNGGGGVFRHRKHIEHIGAQNAEISNQRRHVGSVFCPQILWFVLFVYNIYMALRHVKKDTLLKGEDVRDSHID